MATGFATYCDNMLRRWNATGKYELAEFAIAMNKEQAESYKAPWDIYSNSPSDKDHPDLVKAFHHNPSYQFGSWRLEQTILDFKPDIVCDIKDPWMNAHTSYSPLLPYFNWVWMPTCDSSPQKQEWMEWFSKADAILAYSEFGVETLREESGDTLNILGTASPAIDERYMVKDKLEVRNRLGLDPEWNIVGTVMRNQVRKLFPELFKSFKLFLDQASPALANKTYLYIHTSYPEKLGWNIPDLISTYGINGKVLATYKCRTCGKPQSTFFKDAMTKCKHCHNYSSVMSSSSFGVSVEEQVDIYNSMDLYVQYANCEGFGLPVPEAAACGVPIAGTDYSAVHDTVKNTGGYPIKVAKMFKDLGTCAERAYPDNQHFAEIMIEHFSLSSEAKEALSKRTVEMVNERYSWDHTAQVWMDYFDNYIPKPTEGQWNTPAMYKQMPEQMPNIPNNYHFLKWLYYEVAREPDAFYGYNGRKTLRDLNFGANMDYGSLEPVTRENVINMFKNKVNTYNSIEKMRVGLEKTNVESFYTKGTK